AGFPVEDVEYAVTGDEGSNGHGENFYFCRCHSDNDLRNFLRNKWHIKGPERERNLSSLDVNRHIGRWGTHIRSAVYELSGIQFFTGRGAGIVQEPAVSKVFVVSSHLEVVHPSSLLSSMHQQIVEF